MMKITIECEEHDGVDMTVLFENLLEVTTILNVKRIEMRVGDS